jgi:hypothetical protein
MEVKSEADHHIDTNVRHQQDPELVAQFVSMSNNDYGQFSIDGAYAPQINGLARSSVGHIGPDAYQQPWQPRFGMFGATSAGFAAGFDASNLWVNTQDRLVYERYDYRDEPSVHTYNHGDVTTIQHQHVALAAQHSPPQQHCQQEQCNSYYDIRFPNLSAAISTIPPRVWSFRPSDSSIPTNDVDRQYWVLKLLIAINNIADVYDSRGPIFQKRWNAVTNGPSNHYSAADKEMVAWDILALAESLHQNGPSAFLSFDKDFWNKAVKTESWTFEERMNKIVELLSSSKSRCEKVLGGTSVHIVVANPDILIKTTKVNSRQNGRRQQVLEAGRAAKKSIVC